MKVQNIILNVRLDLSVRSLVKHEWFVDIGIHSAILNSFLHALKPESLHRDSYGIEIDEKHTLVFCLWLLERSFATSFREVKEVLLDLCPSNLLRISVCNAKLYHGVFDRFCNEIIRCMVLICAESNVRSPMPHEELVFFEEVVIDKLPCVLNMECLLLWQVRFFACQIEIVLRTLFTPEIFKVFPRSSSVTFKVDC